MAAYVLSQADVDVLREIVRDWTNIVSNIQGRGGRDPDAQEQQAPEVYIAKVPEDGIIGFDYDTGTGTGTGSGTGTADGLVSYADCVVYKLLPDKSLVSTRGTKRVHNLSGSDIAGNTYVVVSRDKFGIWWVVGAVGGSGGSAVDRRGLVADHVHVVALGTGTGTAAPEWYCERVTISAGWPPVADPDFTYLGVFESENREPRIIDTPGGDVTHIIPLFHDGEGGYYIVFWKTDTSIEWEYPSAFTITEDDNCNITATPMLTTKRISLNVAPPDDTTTGLVLDIETIS